jgi:hypothetical protein
MRLERPENNRQTVAGKVLSSFNPGKSRGFTISLRNLALTLKTLQKISSTIYLVRVDIYLNNEMRV